jgi:bacteriocin biosynthesis cyclodehydratase domain-containing protein
LTALEAIKLITGLGSPLRSHLLTMDLNRLEFAKYRTYRDPRCPVCASSTHLNPPLRQQVLLSV